jgi:AhpD family alkylhydroperoxidase
MLRALVNRRVAWWNGCEYCLDAHAAKGSRRGISTEKIEALNDYEKSLLFGDAEKVALEYADSITDTRRDVVDELVACLLWHCDYDPSAELTMIIAWQNASSPFNHAFRIPS